MKTTNSLQPKHNKLFCGTSFQQFSIFIKNNLRMRVILEAVLITAVLLWSAGIVQAQLTPSGTPSTPNTQMPNLEQLYNRFDSGAGISVQSTFTEPTSGPSTTTMRTLNELMGVLPEQDTTNCAITSEVLTGKTFWGLCAGSGWGLLTGTGSLASAPPAPTATTGQTVCYNAGGSAISCTGTGQDGEYQMGETTSPRFTDNLDGTITDNLTGLIWLQEANCSDTAGTVSKVAKLTWADSLTWSNNLASGSCGLTDGSVAGDWRLPNFRELASLIDYGIGTIGTAPKIPAVNPFTNFQTDHYWTSTTYRPGSANAWFVSFNSANIFYATKANTEFVLPVR